jgi:hypothetical protein
MTLVASSWYHSSIVINMEYYFITTCHFQGKLIPANKIQLYAIKIYKLNKIPTRVSPFTANPYNLSLEHQNQMFSEKS